MAVTPNRVSVSDSAVVEVIRGGDELAAATEKVKNMGVVTAYLGGNNVAVGTGYALEAGESETFALPRGTVMYATADAGGTILHTLRISPS